MRISFTADPHLSFSFYAERRPKQLISILQLQIRIPEHGLRPLTVQPRGVVIDLHLVEHVDVRLAGQLRGRHVAERPVDIIARLLAEEAHLSRDAAVSQQLAQGLVVTLFAVFQIVSHQPQSRPPYNLQCRIDERRRHLEIGGLQSGCLRRDVVHIGDALVGHGHLVGCQTEQVADTATNGAVQHKQVLGPLQLRRHLTSHHLSEFLGPQEYRGIVHHVHDMTPFLHRDFPEGGAAYFVGMLEFGEEGLQEFQVVDHRRVAHAFLGRTMAGSPGVEFRIKGHVAVLVADKLAQFEHHLVGEGPHGNRHATGDSEKTIQFLGLAQRHRITAVAHHPIAMGLVDKSQESGVHQFGLFSDMKGS